MALSPRTYTPPTPFTVKLIAVCLLLAVLWWGRPFLAPLCLAGFVALTLNPLVTKLSRALPRALAAVSLECDPQSLREVVADLQVAA